MAALGNTNAGGGATCSGWGAAAAIDGQNVIDPGGGNQFGLVFITEPLNAVTVAGTITVNARALENSAMANYGVGAVVYQIAAGNGGVTRIGFNGNTTELGTSEAAVSISITPTSTALSANDMLALWIYWGAAGGTSASGFTATYFYNGTTSAASGDTFVTFTEAITEATVGFQPRPPAANLTTSPGMLMEKRNWLWLPRRPRLWRPELWTPPVRQPIPAIT